MATQVTLNSGSVDSAGSLALKTNGTTTAVTIDTSQNVGIGTGSPGTKLQAVGIIKSGATGTNGEFNLARTSDGLSVGKISLTESTQILDYNNLLGSGVHTFTINTAERMRIDSSGNVGIGTTSPLQRLDVASSSTGVFQAIRSTSSGATNVGLRIQDGTTGTGNGDGIYLGRTGAENYLWTYENEPWVFGTNNTERARITSSGNLLVNTSSVLLAGSGSIQAQAIGTGGAILGKSSEWSTYTQYIWNATTADNSRFVSFNTEGTATERGSIDFNRGATLTRYNTTSDATLKNIKGDSDGKKSIDILKSTRIREYAWKEDAEQKSQIGVIAQELYETYKGAVSEGGEDANGKYKPWGVDKTAFTFHLVAGWQKHEQIIQEQQALITALTSRITALEQA
jgi:hypothetical protein